MNRTPKVDPNDLPSLGELRTATVVALVVVVVLIATVVLPAERGIDVTGVGGWLGLTAMGELKMEARAPVEDSPTIAVEAQAPFEFRTDELQLSLRPGEGSEIKAVMREGDQLVYSWATDNGELYFDFHGEPTGAASNVFTSFERDTLSVASGEFDAPFDGTHGWYWQNRTDAPITVELKTSGVYQSISRK